MKLKLGLFAINSMGGISLLKKNIWKANWVDIVKLVKKADKNSIDFILPLSKYTGWSGKSNPHGFAFETFAMTSALINLTKNIRFISTIHIPFINPVLAAKICKSIIAMENGVSKRLLLNIVAGVMKSDLKMFNATNFPLKNKYRVAEDWIKVFKKIIVSNKKTQINTKNYKYENVSIDINYKVKKYPQFVSAGYSIEGRNFALKNCDYQFTFFHNLQSAKKANLNFKKINNKIKLLTNIHIISAKNKKDTEKKIKKYFKLIDKSSVRIFHKNLISNQPNLKKVIKLNDKMISNIGFACGSYCLAGTPNEISYGLKQLQKAGFYGVALSFFDYDKDFNFFCNHIIPKLKKNKII